MCFFRGGGGGWELEGGCKALCPFLGGDGGVVKPSALLLFFGGWGGVVKPSALLFFWGGGGVCKAFCPDI